MQKFPFFENLPGEPSDFVAIKVELKVSILIRDKKGVLWNQTK